jgi:tetratricopeptide (TPR) repeat protein
VLALVGEPGVGKSRLLAEVTRQSRAEGWRVLACQTTPGGELTSYLPIVQLLRAGLHIAVGDDPTTVAAKAAAAALGLDGALQRAVPALQSVLDAPVDDPAWTRLDAALRRQRVLDAVTDLLVRASQEHPLVVIFENLHWIDPESQACLDHLVEGLAGARILLLASHRPEYTPPWGGTSHYNPVGLGPLPAEAAAELLRALLGDDPRLAPVIAVLVEHTSGNPLFLEECVRALSETGVLSTTGTGGTAAPITELEGLATVHAVLAARVNRLGSVDLRLLEMGAVIGPRIAMSVLSAMAGLDEAALAAAVARLKAAEFLHETGPFPGVELTFTRPLMHEIVYGGLPPERRREIHAQALAAMEGLSGKSLSVRPDVLGDHAFHGGLWGKAVTYLRQAGTRAASRATNGEAVARFQRALEAIAHLSESRATTEQAIDLRLDLRPSLLQLGRLAEVLAVSREAEALAQRIGDEPRLARVYTYLANYHYLKGEPDVAIGYGERCAAIGLAQGDAPLVALARAYMGYSYHAQGRYREAREVLAENLSMLEPLRRGESSMQTSVSHVGSAAWLAFTLSDLGEFEAAEEAGHTARQIADESRNPYSLAIAATYAAHVWLARGHLDRAVPALEATLATCRDNHLVVWQPVPSALLGVALARAGEAARGVQLLEEAVALTERLGVRAYLARWTGHLAEGLQVAGRIDHARDAAETALRLGIAHHERAHQAEALRLLGELTAAAGPAGATQGERRLRQALSLAGEVGSPPLTARCHLSLAGLAGQRGDLEQAREHLAAAEALCASMDLRLPLDRVRAEIDAPRP